MRSCLICDDHALMRGALAMAVQSRWPDAALREAGDFPQSWSMAEAKPELCLVDLIMPGAAPVEGVSRLIEIAPDARMIVVTGSHDDAMLLELLGIGVHGFLPKTSTGDVILAAIDLVNAGGRYLPPRVAELALNRPEPRISPAPAAKGCGDRRREVLLLVAQGRSNKEIARALGVSPATVKTHVANAMASVGAVNRTDAAIRAREMGLI